MSENETISKYEEARNNMILSFDFVWNESSKKLERLIAESQNYMSPENHSLIVSSYETLTDGIVASIHQELIKKHAKLSSLQNHEAFFFKNMTQGLADVFKGLLQAYLVNSGYTNGSENISKLSIKFNSLNMDIRHPSRRLGPSGIWAEKKVEELFRTYQGIVDMIRLTRNFGIHIKEQSTINYFQSINRKVAEPIVNAESPGGFFVIISMVTIVIHEFIDILQIWIDTATVPKN